MRRGKLTGVLLEPVHALDSHAVVHRLAEPAAAARVRVDVEARFAVQREDVEIVASAGIARMPGERDVSYETAAPSLGRLFECHSIAKLLEAADVMAAYASDIIAREVVGA